ncbi:MAG: hypothetical protein HFG34_01865 [Eubacterium sp.]|nr:hypothetical protein [Eubacterium sp.]
MAITGIGNNYSSVYEGTYTSGKNEEVKKTETKDAASAQAGKTKSTGNSNVSDYYSYLAKKYDCVKNGNVAISGAYLKECAKNADKAKELEENLAFYKASYKSGYESAKANARAIGARLTNYSESWSIDSTGNVVMQASATVVSDTKGWRELKEERDERIKEKREQEEKEKKIKEKKEERQEQLDRAGGDSPKYTIEEIRERDMISGEAVLVQKERLEAAYYPKFDMNI